MLGTTWDAIHGWYYLIKSKQVIDSSGTTWVQTEIYPHHCPRMNYLNHAWRGRHPKKNTFLLGINPSTNMMIMMVEIIIMMMIMVILMIMMTKLATIMKISLLLSQNCPILRTNTWWKKAQQKLGKGRPPSLFQAMPEGICFLGGLH